jgi:hypothetical protein
MRVMRGQFLPAITNLIAMSLSHREDLIVIPAKAGARAADWMPAFHGHDDLGRPRYPKTSLP